MQEYHTKPHILNNYFSCLLSNELTSLAGHFCFLPALFIMKNKYLSLIFVLLCSHHPLVSIQLYLM